MGGRKTARKQLLLLDFPKWKLILLDEMYTNKFDFLFEKKMIGTGDPMRFKVKFAPPRGFLIQKAAKGLNREYRKLVKLKDSRIS